MCVTGRPTSHPRWHARGGTNRGFVMYVIIHSFSHSVCPPESIDRHQVFDFTGKDQVFVIPKWFHGGQQANRVQLWGGGGTNFNGAAGGAGGYVCVGCNRPQQMSYRISGQRY
jgi:hypothetical protein